MSTLILLDHIHSNPYQTRLIDQAYVEQVLAPDIAARGLLQPPTVRPHPTLDGHYQLAFGHHRFAAFQYLAAQGGHQTDGLPCEIVNLTDRELFEQAIVENEKRRPTSPIEKAQALKRYLAEFKVTQAEAGQLFGLDQPSVSNLLRLLTLPDKTQQLVQDGALPERLARQVIPLAEYFPDRAHNVAAVIAKTPDKDRDRIIKETLTTAWKTHGRWLHLAPFTLDWQPDPEISAEMFDQAKGEPKEPPACAKCPAKVKYDGDEYCGKPACYNLKQRIYLHNEVLKASKKTGIAAAGPDEETVLLYDGTSYNDQNPKRLAQMKLPVLRLVPRPPKDGPSYLYYLREITGSDYVALATVDKRACEKALAAQAKEDWHDTPLLSSTPAAEETPKQREKRLAREKAEREAKYAEAARWHRARADCRWLLLHTAETLAPQLQISGPILDECEQELTQRDYIDIARGVRDLETVLEKRIRGGEVVDDLRRAHILFNTFVEACFVDHYSGGAMLEYQQKYLRFDKVVEHITERTDELGLKLPTDWQRVPVHHTPLNCWQCGTFGRDPEQITPTELKLGWCIEGKPEAPTAVYCPDCAKEVAAAKVEPKPAVAKPSRTRSTLNQPGWKNPTAQAAMQAHAKNGRKAKR